MLRKVYFTLVCLMLSGLLPATAQEVRQKILFTKDWKFHKGDLSDAQNSTFDDSGWSVIDLPHDWSIHEPFTEKRASGTAYLPAGIGWYRKSFDRPEEMNSKKIYIYFDGVYKNSEVWINGKLLGKRPNGFISFYYDITPYLNKKNNILAVRVDHTDFADSRWYTGSGINRNVYIIATNPVHIPIWGMKFSTPEVTRDEATVQIDISIENPGKKDLDLSVKCDLIDKNGQIAGSEIKRIAVPANQPTVLHMNFTVTNPRLWSVSDPNLYDLQVSVTDDHKIVDQLTEQVGIRTFHFDPDSGFSLNGKNMKIKGVCLHDDAGALGTAVPESVWRRRLEKLKAMGCNAIRMSHNPHADYFYELCDELGFLVQDESYDEWELGKNKWIEGWNVGTPGKDGYNQDFEKWAERDLRDMILRNINRPSIIMWSIGNEIDYPNDPYSHEVLSTGRNPQIYGKGYQPDHPPAKRLGEISKELVRVVKETDTTRPVTAALAGVVMSNFTEYPGSLDLVGYNYQEYRYHDDHTKYPDRIIYGSENSKSYNAWMAVDSNAYISSQFLWTGIDYLGEARAWPSRSSEAGLLDLAGFEKNDYYFRKSLWSESPIVYIGTSLTSGNNRRWSRSEPVWNYESGDSVSVRIYSNQQETALYLNDSLVSTKSQAEARNGVLVWRMIYEPGVLTAIGLKDNVEECHYSLITPEAASRLAVSTDKQTIRADRDEVAHIEIFVEDAQGILCYDTQNQIDVEISGPGRLIGLENGSSTSHEDYHSSSRKALHGKLLAYIQATDSGLITVRISSPDLDPVETTFVAR